MVEFCVSDVAPNSDVDAGRGVGAMYGQLSGGEATFPRNIARVLLARTVTRACLSAGRRRRERSVTRRESKMEGSSQLKYTDQMNLNIEKGGPRGTNLCLRLTLYY